MKALIVFSLSVLCITSQVIELQRSGSRASHANMNFLQSNKAGNFTMDNMKDMQYYAAMTMGTPAQDITLVFDTGSPELWISMLDGKYSAKKSSTANISTTAGHIQYGKGYVAGYTGTEVVGVP